MGAACGSFPNLAETVHPEPRMLRRYVGMTWTSFAALVRLSVPTVTVIKNLTNLFVIVGVPHSLQGSCVMQTGSRFCCQVPPPKCRLHQQLLQ